MEWSLHAPERACLRLGEGGDGATRRSSAGGRRVNRGSARRTATHLTEKRWAGRSPPPREGSRRPTVLSPASFFGSLRSRADNYMSKWHIPFRAHGGDPSAGRAWGREGDWRARGTGSERGRPSPRPRGRGPAERGQRVRVSVRAGGSGLECVRVVLLVGPDSYFPGWASAFSLPPHFLALSPWLVNNKKQGFGKGFPKKVDCKQAVAFRPLPPAGLCSAPFSVSSHLQSKLGGKGGVAGRSCLLHPILSFFPVSFPHTCPAAAVIKAPSVISNAPPSPAAAPQRN